MTLAPRITPRIDDLASWLAGGPKARRLIFVNGHVMPELSHVGGLPQGVVVKGFSRVLQDEPDRAADALARLDDEDRSLSSLNAAFATGGAWIELPTAPRSTSPCRSCSSPWASTAAAMTNPRNVIRLGKGARLRLIETHGSLGEGHSLTNMVTQLELAEGSELVHDRLQLGRDGSTLINRTAGRLAARSRLAKTTATLGHTLGRNEDELRLLGPEIEALLNGLYMPAGQEHVDTLIRIHHIAPECHSNQFYKGVVDGRSHARVRRQDHRPARGAEDRRLPVRRQPAAFGRRRDRHQARARDLCRRREVQPRRHRRRSRPAALFYLRSRGLPRGHRREPAHLWLGRRGHRPLRRRRGPDRARKAVLDRLPGGQALEGL